MQSTMVFFLLSPNENSFYIQLFSFFFLFRASVASHRDESRRVTLFASALQKLWPVSDSAGRRDYSIAAVYIVRTSRNKRGTETDYNVSQNFMPSVQSFTCVRNFALVLRDAARLADRASARYFANSPSVTIRSKRSRPRPRRTLRSTPIRNVGKYDPSSVEALVRYVNPTDRISSAPVILV